MQIRILYALLIIILLGMTFIIINKIEMKYVRIHKTDDDHNHDIVKCISEISNNHLGAITSIHSLSKESQNYFLLGTKDSQGRTSSIECNPSNNQMKAKKNLDLHDLL